MTDLFTLRERITFLNKTQANARFAESRAALDPIIKALLFSNWMDLNAAERRAFLYSCSLIENQVDLIMREFIKQIFMEATNDSFATHVMD